MKAEFSLKAVLGLNAKDTGYMIQDTVWRTLPVTIAGLRYNISNKELCVLIRSQQFFISRFLSFLWC